MVGLTERFLLVMLSSMRVLDIVYTYMQASIASSTSKTLVCLFSKLGYLGKLGSGVCSADGVAAAFSVVVKEELGWSRSRIKSDCQVQG